MLLSDSLHNINEIIEACQFMSFSRRQSSAHLQITIDYRFLTLYTSTTHMMTEDVPVYEKRVFDSCGAKTRQLRSRICINVYRRLGKNSIKFVLMEFIKLQLSLARNLTTSGQASATVN